RCEENRPEALRRTLINGRVLCVCCTSRKKPEPGPCRWCGKTHVPFQDHHPWGWKLQAAIGPSFADETWKICENCHAWMGFYLLPLMDQQDPDEKNGIIIFCQFVAVCLMYGVIIFKPQHALFLREVIFRMNSDAKIY